jgi:hypothetical protein
MSTPLRPVQHLLIGHPVQVAAVLRAAQARGHLVGMSHAEHLPGHRVAVTVTLLQPPTKTMRRQARAARWRKVWRIVKPIGIGLLATAIVSGFGWLGWLAVQWVTAHWVPVVVIGVGLLLGYGVVTAMDEDRGAPGGRR